MTTPLRVKKCLFFLILCLAGSRFASAQTESDALMIPKNYLCSGAFFTHSSWSSYWEGTFRRTNGNLGTVSTNTYSLMANYGITNRLNVLVSVPYVTTHASAGTLEGQSGFQDLMLSLKYVAIKTKYEHSQFRLITTLSGALPISNYEADFMPMSIGGHSRSLMGRVTADYQYAHVFITGSGAYIYRDNIAIDRNSYYTTSMHYTNQVYMPDQAQLSLRTGLRTRALIAEVVAEHMVTLGGFDIRKNDMPFPSNRMNSNTVGLNFKYSSTLVRGLELSAGGDYVISGRNAGQSRVFHAGLYYLANLSGSSKIGAAK